MLTHVMVEHSDLVRIETILGQNMEKCIKMKLYNDPILIRLDLIELVEPHSYEREIGRKFCKKPSGDRSRDRQGQLRPLRFSKWGNGISNKKQRKIHESSKLKSIGCFKNERFIY